jgi:hypothetical protein
MSARGKIQPALEIAVGAKNRRAGGLFMLGCSAGGRSGGPAAGRRGRPRRSVRFPVPLAASPSVEMLLMCHEAPRSFAPPTGRQKGGKALRR